MTALNDAANLAAIDQQYALVKELLTDSPVAHAKALLAERPGDELGAWALVADDIRNGIGDHPDGLSYVVDLLAAAAVRLAKEGGR